MRRILMLGLLAFVPGLAAQGETKPLTPTDQHEALLKEYEAASNIWMGRYDPESADVDFVERYKEWPGWSFAPQFLDLAQKNPNDPVAFDALLWVVGLGQAVTENDRLLLPHYEQASDILIRDYIEDERLGKVCWLMARDLSSPAENFLRVVLEKSPSRKVRGRACLGLAEYLAGKRAVAQRPFFDEPRKTPFQEFTVTRYDPASIQYIRGADPKALFKEAERLFEQVITEYGDIPALNPSGTMDDEARTLADVAKPALYALRNLSLGMVAPEIEGEDIDGEPMRLSDHRGKVVALVSWATWCNPCMGMVPHERGLVERLKGRPFALLGINGDTDRDQAKKVMQEKGIIWRSWWNEGPEGPITQRWNIRSWPTIYVLDAEGVIRYKQVRDEQLDEAVDTLLKEMEAEAKP